MNTIEIQEALACFHGTTSYYSHQLLPGHQLKLTDGCHYLRETCKCYWLFDIIASYHGQLKEAAFQVWHLKKKKGHVFTISCTDGNNNELASQDIPFSDFPLESIKIWVVNSVAMLPSEY